jgi:hypothetical protein
LHNSIAEKGAQDATTYLSLGSYTLKPITVFRGTDAVVCSSARPSQHYPKISVVEYIGFLK